MLCHGFCLDELPRLSVWGTVSAMRALRRTGIWLGSLLLGVFLVMLLSVMFLGCRALFPAERSFEERLSAFPVDGLPLTEPVTVRWSDHAVPFIEAGHDLDLATTLGSVHAHLRAGQVFFLRMVSQGRLSEMGGPVAASIDEALNILDFGHAAPEIIEKLPGETRAWLEAYLRGFNHYLAHAPQRPPEARLLNLDTSPYTLTDLVTLSRLASTDVNWGTYFSLLRARLEPDWEARWQRNRTVSASSVTSFEGGDSLAALQALLEGHSKSGSNSVVIGPSKSADGHAMIANDPHLGRNIPNFWLLVGYQSPGYTGVGAMIPGIPILAFGRTPHLSWGGTNMRAGSSELYDVSGLDPEQFATTEKRLRVRFWRDRSVTQRWSPYGPVLSDAEVLPAREGEQIALRWVGHDPSDEWSAFLSAMRAETIPEFVEGFRHYGVSGQNLLMADAQGNIAMLLAARLPRRPFTELPDLVLDPDNPQHAWQGFITPPELPLAYNPEAGFIASANNRPTVNNPPIGFFFSQPERIQRLQQLLESTDRFDFEGLKALQQDTRSPAAAAVNAALLPHLRGLDLDGADPDGAAVALREALERWDGDYAQDSRGPVAFELLLYHLLQRFPEGGDAAADRSGWTYVSLFLAQDLDALPEAERSEHLRSALLAAAADWPRYPDWGSLHFQQGQYIAGGIPYIGRFFRYWQAPASGSRETIHKTFHGFSNAPMGTGYGSQSRHISLMRDLDENYFVLFGGQDGWLGSANLTDQLPLWERGAYLRLPLSPGARTEAYPHVQVLSP